jgi:alpha-L-rhamnosidase
MSSRFEEFSSTLRHPPGPMTRWRWFGGAITPEEITRELTFMRDAGLGGVELQPVYPVSIDDPKLGIRNTPYFSDRWFDLMRHVARETARLGLQFDFILGGGWPPLVRWSEEHKVIARIQAHGAMGDVMRAYGLAHVPEGETWLREPLFLVTLEIMKAASDGMFSKVSIRSSITVTPLHRRPPACRAGRSTRPASSITTTLGGVTILTSPGTFAAPERYCARELPSIP